MGVITFAAIDVGSYNVSMDIYEMSPRTGIRHIDQVKSRLEIGQETYSMRYNLKTIFLIIVSVFSIDKFIHSTTY